MKNKKIVITITSIVAVLLVIIGVTYAYWLVTKTQTNSNIIGAGCLDISLTGEKNDIELQDQFPLSDEDGMKLVPYEFTVTNNCTTSVDYQVNLESIGDSANAIKASAIKVALNDDIKLLTAGGNAEPTVSGAYESNMILYGTLAGLSEETEDDTVTYELRIWIDANAPISEQNKTFQSKITVTIGQGITNPYKEGTLAYDILSNYGGADAITSLSYEWSSGEGKEDYHTFLYDTSYYWATSYSFDTATGYYELKGDIIKATLEECRQTEGLCGEYFIGDSYRPNILKERFMGKITAFTDPGQPDNSSYMFVRAKRFGSTNVFSYEPASSEIGLYKVPDDLGESYIFRGNPTNTYVKFGTYKDDIEIKIFDFYMWQEKTIELKAGAPIYWRIVRINGDGTIRLIYDGTAPVANGVTHTATIGATAYNINHDDAKYLGYTYDVNGTETDSTIKGVVDKWYEDNLEKTYGKYITDGIFCNDKQVSSNDDFYTNFASNYRLHEQIPQLKCANKNDRYTISDKKGNGLLTKPVGLLTFDEALFAGYVMVGSGTNYLNSGEEFWLSSPDTIYNNERFYVSSVGHMGTISSNEVNYSIIGARPVINLKADVKFTGDGRIDTNTPYEIVME